MDGIYTMANDRMAPFLETFLRSVRHFMPSMPVAIIPFDDSLERTRQLAEMYSASVVGADPTWDAIGKNIYGDSDYRPGIPAYRYYRKFNAFTGPFKEFCFMDVNSIALGDVEELENKLPPQYDILFLKRSAPFRTIKNASARSVMQVLSPGFRTGFNAGFFRSRYGTISPTTAQQLGRNVNLRRLFGMAPEQAFLAWYVCIFGLRHQIIGEFASDIQDFSSGAKYSVEKRHDGRYHFAEGPSAGRLAYVLKWTGQDPSAVRGEKNADLFAMFSDQTSK